MFDRKYTDVKVNMPQAPHMLLLGKYSMEDHDEWKINLTGTPLVSYRKLTFITEEIAKMDKLDNNIFFFFFGCFFFSFRSVHPDV